MGLAKLLITQPRLLLLDEPDNHLDLNGKAFLERTINDYHGAVVIVSHDRYLLDHVVDEIAELEAGRVTTCTPALIQNMRSKKKCAWRGTAVV